MKLNNTYFVLRHGETIYQTKKRNFTYPRQDNPHVKLTKRGEKQIKAVAKKLKKAKIDLIYSSDFFRVGQTARIVARELGLKIKFNKKLRDTNLGVYHNGTKKEFYHDFPYAKERFSKMPKKGENWDDVKKRMLNFLREIDKKYRKKRILIISHGDPLWLLEGTIKGLTNRKLLDEIFVKKNFIKTGELRKLWN